MNDLVKSKNTFFDYLLNLAIFPLFQIGALGRICQICLVFVLCITQYPLSIEAEPLGIILSKITEGLGYIFCQLAPKVLNIIILSAAPKAHG